ncbi:molybdopterin-dependent oxidoreductase [Adlercreutzia faecimuris]|uniref:Molybdopterin-dependent oxidoreductase n=1 Tax=Adlercreutzia faecimuris TaxID=2897341 RepID=A0ABS9WF12_9ACTN|nr:molybdopterin-dependent oxidoreductase [Adlercreutzia sp. JBNU-10]MCI2241155.1 molybdopterin-dependent oxidoreductase [Adlercreutzia sp. JBNU-10]
MRPTDQPIDRRSFLRIGAAAGAAAVLAAQPLTAFADEPADPGAVEAPDDKAASAGKWVMSSCQGCTSNCAVRVRVEHGRAVKVEGNPNAKGNHGCVCPNAMLALQQLYDPDRVKYPMRRTNPEKGRGIDPGFVPISWDEALGEIADKMLELRNAGEAYKLAMAKGRSTGIADVFHKALPEIYGSPNRFSHAAICAEAEKLATGALCGYWDYHDYDLLHAKYLILWGTDPISSNRQISNAISQFGKMRANAKVIVVDPRLSATAAKADKWLPIIPGTDGALASAIAHVILAEGLWNREFVGDFTDGTNYFAYGKPLDESLWQQYGKYRGGNQVYPGGPSSGDEYWFDEKKTYGICRWWNLELHDKTPEWAAEICGIDADDIYQIARDFATQKAKAVSWISPGVTMTPRGGYTGMACFALNGLAGSYETEGGILRSPSAPTGHLADLYAYKDSKAKKALKKPKADQRQYFEFVSIEKAQASHNQNTNRIADAILAEEPYGLKMMIAYWNNWVFSCTGTARWEEALAKLPYLVHITTNPSEMSQFADIVLPAKHHMFEAWGFVKNKMNLYAYLSVEQPCVETLFEARNDETEIAWDLAQKLAEKGWPNLADYYRIECRDPYTGNQPTNAEEFGESVVKIFTQPAWDPAFAAGGDDLKKWADFLKNGVWNSDRMTYKKHYSDFGTKTGKFEFYSETLKEVLQGHVDRYKRSVNELMEACNYQARDGRAFVPHYEEPYRNGDPDEFPLIFSEHRSRLNREGRSANTTWYQDFKDADPGDEPWDDVLKVNPRDMAALGLADGDEVDVVSPTGSIRVRARAWEGTRPGVVVKCYGQGHWAYGHVAAADYERAIPRGGNNNDLLVAEWEHLSSSTARHGGNTRVRVERVRSAGGAGGGQTEGEVR